MATAGLTVSSSWSPGHALRGMEDRSPLGSDSSDEDVPLETRSERSSSNPVLPGRQRMDPMDVPWYHPCLSRHLAEAELRNAEEGVYLMRPRTEPQNGSLKGFAIDVRTRQSVMHFPVALKPDCWVFGQETFTSIDQFLEHFDNRPLLGDDAGRLIVLKFPYPRDVDENPDYHSAVITHFLSNPPKEERNRKRSPLSLRLSDNFSRQSPPTSHCKTEDTPPIHTLSLASKSGYLVKMGNRVRSWKRRWFVLKDRYLSYYSKETDERPIRNIDLSEATSISNCDALEKPNLFQVVLPWRTFYMQAPNAEVRRDWVDLLNWRLGEIQKHKPRSQSGTSLTDSTRDRLSAAF